LELSVELNNALPVGFEVSLDGVRRPSAERLNFLLSQAVVVGFLGCPLSEAVASVAIWWDADP
jgi:hypothetical protein